MALTTFAPQHGVVPSTRLGTHRQWHNRPGWPAVLFKEPIQGVKVAGRCTFPTYDAVSRKHRDLVTTIGEEETRTCAGVMYFGDWFSQLERLEADAVQNGARSDTVRPAVVSFPVPDSNRER